MHERTDQSEALGRTKQKGGRWLGRGPIRRVDSGMLTNQNHDGSVRTNQESSSPSTSRSDGGTNLFNIKIACLINILRKVVFHATQPPASHSLIAGLLRTDC